MQGRADSFGKFPYDEISEEEYELAMVKYVMET